LPFESLLKVARWGNRSVAFQRFDTRLDLGMDMEERRFVSRLPGDSARGGPALVEETNVATEASTQRLEQRGAVVGSSRRRRDLA